MIRVGKDGVFVLLSVSHPRGHSTVSAYAAGSGGFQGLFGKLAALCEPDRRAGRPSRVAVYDPGTIRRIFEHGNQKPGGGWQSFLKTRGVVETIGFDGAVISDWDRQTRFWRDVFADPVPQGLL